MKLKLYKNLSDKNHVDKSLQLMGEINGTLRDDCSIINPVIKIEDFTGFDFANCNYAYIEEFERYYFINNISCIHDLFELSMHVDVLSTYKVAIRSNTAVISRQENFYNLYLQDGIFKTEAFPHIQVKQFPDGFSKSDFNFIFCVAG